MYIAPSNGYPFVALEFFIRSFPWCLADFGSQRIPQFDPALSFRRFEIVVVLAKDSGEVGIFYFVESIPAVVVEAFFEYCKKHEEQ